MNWQCIITVRPAVAPTKWKVTQPLSVMVLFLKKEAERKKKGQRKGPQHYRWMGGDVGSDDEGSHLIKFEK